MIIFATLTTYTKNKMENIIEPGSIISVGRYEILFATAPYYDEENNMVDNKKVIQYLNNAAVKYGEIDLKYTINWLEKWKSISSVNFLMPEDKTHLMDIFVTTPYGLIKKNRTGIGATTLELNSPRNSIVVVPTRSLAYGKAVNSKIEGETNKYKILYVGGKITGFDIPSISDYLLDSSIEYKKFIVVADSLPILLSVIGKDNFKDYFFMVDEIDSYQYDCSYRPKMEDVIDYYFQFPPSKRCLVSATIGNFSNKKIEEEPVINVEFCNPQPRNIKLIHTDDAEVRTKKTIEEIYSANPNEKILIAYNSVRGCITAINSLDANLKSQCAILCSSTNKGITEYYDEILEENLPKKITFMTCTYFVGIDIKERFHLISVVNTQKPYTVLSIDKLQQIAGRCRSKEGLLSETIIYTTTEAEENIDLQDIQKRALEDAKQMSDFGDLYPQLKFKFPNSYLFRDEFVTKKFIESSKKKYGRSGYIRMIRKDIYGKFVPSYFNIDFIRIQVEMLNYLYSKGAHLAEKMRNTGHYIECYDYTESEIIPDDIRENTDAEFQQANIIQREEIISRLQEADTIEDRKRIAKILSMGICSQQNRLFLEYFIELQEYAPFRALIEKLNSFDTDCYDKFYNFVIFWALDDAHSIKSTIHWNLPTNTPFTGEELTEKFNAIYSGVLGYAPLTPRQAIPIIRNFCTISERTSKRVEGKPIGAYKVIDYNPFGLEGEPLKRITANQNMKSFFRF